MSLLNLVSSSLCIFQFDSHFADVRGHPSLPQFFLFLTSLQITARVSISVATVPQSVAIVGERGGGNAAPGRGAGGFPAGVASASTRRASELSKLAPSGGLGGLGQRRTATQRTERPAEAKPLLLLLGGLGREGREVRAAAVRLVPGFDGWKLQPREPPVRRLLPARNSHASVRARCAGKRWELGAGTPFLMHFPGLRS